MAQIQARPPLVMVVTARILGLTVHQHLQVQLVRVQAVVVSRPKVQVRLVQELV